MLSRDGDNAAAKVELWLASVLQAASFYPSRDTVATQWRRVRGPYYLGVGSISDSLSLFLRARAGKGCCDFAGP